MKKFIPVYKPYLNGNERKYLNECLDSTWISSKGEYIQAFEKNFCCFVDAPFAISVCNGTVALHLALLGLEIKPHDEIIVPALTYVATVNAIKYMGAVPVFADSLPSHWQIDPHDVRRKISRKTKAILAVHLYGHPSDMEELKEIADENEIFLVEDCAEAFGSFYRGRHVGNHGIVSTYSFFGNKTITTGEGGMVVCHNEALFRKMSMLKNQGCSSTRAYWHEEIGYNYRMTNLAAAIGVAQLEQASEILDKKRRIAEKYAEALQGLPVQLHTEKSDCKHSYWMVSILVEKAGIRDMLRDFLLSQKIETRPFFHPIHRLPMYVDSKDADCPIAEDLSARGINLPSFPDLSLMEVEFICGQIKAFYNQGLFFFSAAAAMPEVLQISS